MPMDLRLKDALIKQSLKRETDRKEENERIKNLPYDQRVAMALEMGFPSVPLTPPQKVKKAS